MHLKTINDLPITRTYQQKFAKKVAAVLFKCKYDNNNINTKKPNETQGKTLKRNTSIQNRRRKSANIVNSARDKSFCFFVTHEDCCLSNG